MDYIAEGCWGCFKRMLTIIRYVQELGILTILLVIRTPMSFVSGYAYTERNSE